MSAPHSASAGWHPDPTSQHQLRYWDGSRWTDDVADNGTQSKSPLAGAAAVTQVTTVPVFAVAGAAAPLAPVMPKNKTTAILLAVFLSLWTWCYTYKVDSWKFWMNLVLSFLTVGIWGVIVAWPWAIIDAARRPQPWYDQFPNGDVIRNQQGYAGAAALVSNTHYASPTPQIPAPPAAQTAANAFGAGTADTATARSPELPS